MEKIRNIIWLVLATILFASVSEAQENSVCAAVRIEIRQELAFERQAFEAEMVITNSLDTATLDNVNIEVIFQDEDGHEVLATSDPKNTDALFFIRLDSLNNIGAIDGSGVIAQNTSATISWLIIPSPGAAGESLSGLRYFVGAKLSYRLGGKLEEVAVAPDFITVKPQPELNIDYFLTEEVRADDPFTPQIEAPEPFSLGVRIINVGNGIARNVKIESAQPKIVENELGLLIGFEITGSAVNDAPAEPTLLINFGDLGSLETRIGRWVMETSLSGRFSDFSARFTHSDELGGKVTSLLNRVGAHFLVHEVLVDAPGRDSIRDFLANDGGILKVYESQGLDTIVSDLSSVVSLEEKGSANGITFYEIDVPPTAGLLYLKVTDPAGGANEVLKVQRSDGKVLSADNAWFSTTGNGSETRHYFELFDANGGGTYKIQVGEQVLGPKPPVIQFIADKMVPAGSRLTFVVVASDPNGTIPSLSVDARPLGSNFVDSNNGQGVFDWQTAAGQAGVYPITFRASDGILNSARTMKITVTGANDSDGDGIADSWELTHFGTLARDGTGDFDGDGKSDLAEYQQGTDPTFAGDVPGVPEILAPLDGTEVTTLQPTLTLRNITHGVDLPAYDFELYADQGLTQLVAYAANVTEQANGTSWSVPLALNDNARYFWRARSVLNSAQSQWVYGTFFVNTTNDAPGPFNVSSPADGENVDSTVPFLTVTNSIDIDGDALTYYFEVATDEAGEHIVASAGNIAPGSQGTTLWQVQPTLAEGALYYWRAVVTDEHGASTATEWSSFFVNPTNTAPTVPLLLAPVGGVDIATLPVYLQLTNSSDADGDAITYTFQVDTVPTFDSSNVFTSGPVPTDPGGTTSYPLISLSDNTTYYWRAMASDGIASSQWSSEATFRVNSRNDRPTQPVAINPGASSYVDDLTPTFTVTQSFDPDLDDITYYFELATDAAVTNIIASAATSIPTWDDTVTLDDNREYFWHVRAEDEHGLSSPWSQTYGFFTDLNGVNDPPTLSVLEPGAPVSISHGSVLIRWVDADPDSRAAIRVFANDTQISGIISEDPDGDGDTFRWTVDGLPLGAYRIRIEITDGVTTVNAYGCCPINIISDTPPDVDGDGIPDSVDNCRYFPNANQTDAGGIIRATPDGIGNACQCGDVNGDGIITMTDGDLILAATKPGGRPLPHPELCSVDANSVCSFFDGQLVQMTVSFQQLLYALGINTKLDWLQQNCPPAKP